MKVYEAIKRMRELTARRQTFALSYMTYSRARGISHGEVACEHALLIKNPKPSASVGDDGSKMPTEADDFMLHYRDQDTGEARQLWQPLLMSFNHIPLEAIE